MQFKKSHTVEEAKRKLERFCVYQERCHQEVISKLRDMNMIPAAIDQIVTHLIQHDFLNETRFAQSFARGKFNQKKWGKQRIVKELKSRNITSYNIDLALKEISDEAYLQTFNLLVEKRLLQIEKESNAYKKRKKLADYLFYRGWESELVWDAVRQKIKL
jgi:regulatory protein